MLEYIIILIFRFYIIARLSLHNLNILINIKYLSSIFIILIKATFVKSRKCSTRGNVVRGNVGNVVRAAYEAQEASLVNCCWRACNVNTRVVVVVLKHYPLL